ncbi:MAG: LacI family DNA-binding transcriptional regulator, partial [Microbacterium sp.]
MRTNNGVDGPQSRSTRPATMKDVAAAAGVGLGTVSRVFSKQGKVAESTRQRVEQAAAELNYRPSAIGRGLKRQSTQNIGLIVTDISNNFYGEFSQGVLTTARDMDRHVILCASGEDPDAEAEYINLLVEQRVEGIIAFPTGENVEAWQSAIDLGIRVVFADRTIDGLDVPSVVIDNAASARTLTEYLLALGHRRIGYLGGPISLTSGRMREEGFRRAHDDFDAPVDDRLIIRTRFTRDTANASAQLLLDVDPPPTALVAGNNVLGEAALNAVRDRGLRVPEDISIVMFDDVPWAKLVEPPMTVIAQPSWQLGQAATHLVLSAGATGSRILATELIARRSARPWHATDA